MITKGKFYYHPRREGLLFSVDSTNMSSEPEDGTTPLCIVLTPLKSYLLHQEYAYSGFPLHRLPELNDVILHLLDNTFSDKQSKILLSSVRAFHSKIATFYPMYHRLVEIKSLAELEAILDSKKLLLSQLEFGTARYSILELYRKVNKQTLDPYTLIQEPF